MRQLGKFQLLERVGLGAFGAVWRAWDTELERTVALKIPHANMLSSKSELERFHREARAAARNETGCTPGQRPGQAGEVKDLGQASNENGGWRCAWLA